MTHRLSATPPNGYPSDNNYIRDTYLVTSKTCSSTSGTKQWHSRSSTSPETHTFTDCTTDTVIQMGGNLS
ncbi:hypothetical protein TNCV_909181 [Trichonephila clavipes]|nr:hypothetical protein TNCV_909181 [Trichonephila clavipes]